MLETFIAQVISSGAVAAVIASTVDMVVVVVVAGLTYYIITYAFTKYK